jgi:LPXTG-site transpeptidase (sortase) family protein
MGGLLVLVAATALITYSVLIVPGKLSAASGPPEEFLAAATQQARQALAQQQTAQTTATSTPLSADSTPDEPNTTTVPPTTESGDGAPAQAAAPVPTTNPAAGQWALPDTVEVSYWLSIPRLNLEAPVVAYAPRPVEEDDGLSVMRLPVPNSYSVAWDTTSAQPGFGGNTVLTGHNNLYGAVFGNLDELTYGDEVAVWSEYGVFSYYVSEIEYLEEKDQPLDVRHQNATWLENTSDQRVTLVSCWPRSGTHRLLVIATR